MPYEFLTTRRDGPVEHLTLNRPEVRNAFNEGVIAELTEWATTIVGAPDVRAVVLAGAGPTFCAGADVAWMAETASYTEQRNLDGARAAARMLAQLDVLPVPIVGRVQGAALGGGAGLAAVCDVVVAEEGTVFGFTEVKLGILPAVIAPFVLAKIGRSAARALFLSGARFDAARAREIGLVHTVVPAGGLDDAVGQHLTQFLSAAPGAIAAAKSLIHEVHGLSGDAAAAVTAAAIARRRVSSEGQEGLHAFLEKRTPTWSR